MPGWLEAESHYSSRIEMCKKAALAPAIQTACTWQGTGDRQGVCPCPRQRNGLDGARGALDEREGYRGRAHSSAGSPASQPQDRQNRSSRFHWHVQRLCGAHSVNPK